ncbi:MAG TPA: hypothetical protein PKW95_08820 [bacterium]|nr:hypothetical protein [bacterium]
MTITYYLTVEDLIAAYRVQNPPFKQLLYLGILLGILFLVIFFGFRSYKILPLLFIAGVSPILFYLISSIRRKGYAEETIKRSAINDPELYCLTITDEGLIEAMHSTKKLILWRGVHEVVIKKARYFILCEDKQTTVVNVKQVTEGDVFPFIEMVESRIGQR